MEPAIICRACLTSISMEYIDLETPLYGDIKFLDSFNYCTKLEANLEDDLPNIICVSCGRSLQIAYDFLKASINADHMLRESLLLFGDLQHIDGRLKVLQDVDSSIIFKKEEESQYLEYHGECVDPVEKLTVGEIKEEPAEVLPKFEVVISNEDADIEDSKYVWLSADDDDSSWPVMRLEEDDVTYNEEADNIDQDTETMKNSVIEYSFDEYEEKSITNESDEKQTKINKKVITQRGNYICGWCGEAFNCRSKLIQHRVNDHNGEVPSHCLTCGEEFSDETSLRRHVKKEHGIPKKPVLCPYCNKEFKGIALHIKSNHPDILRMSMPDDGSVKLATNQCPYCFRHYQSKNILNDHLNTHTGERPYACGICGKTFHMKTIRDRHEHVVHISKDLPKIKCDLCDFSTSNILSLRSHKHRHRRPIEKKYLCAYCPMTFINPKKLFMHEDFKHGNAEKAYKCEICAKKFCLKTKLKDHMLCVHVHGRPHECADCKKTFKNDFQLKAHQKLHTDRQIDCPQCDKKFARHVDLKIHMRTHTGELPYECHLCDKRYAIKVRLTYHMQKHMGVKHKCPHCPSEFNSRSKLRLHLFKHIGMPYSCDDCQMGYPNRVGLRRHAKSAHKRILTSDDLLENRRKNERNMFKEVAPDTVVSNPVNPESELEI